MRACALASDTAGSGRAGFRSRLLFALAVAVAPALPRAQPPAARVEVTPVVEGPMEERLALSGSIRSPRDGQVFSQVDGYVTGVDVLPGERVAEGQVVLRLDDEIPRLELRRLRALLAEAESLHEDMRRRTREAKDLIEDDNFSRSEYESLRAETLAAEARVATIRAEAAIQETRLRQHAVVAPFDGVVARKLVERGQRISGSTPLLRVFSMDPLWADVRVPEQYLPRISTGDAMEIRPATGAPIGTAVKWIVPAGADQSRTFLVRGEFPNPDWRIAPGMSVRVEIAPGRDAANTLQIPVDAVVRTGDGTARVWVVERGTNPPVARSREVALGRRGGDLTEIVSDELDAGDEVVVRGNEDLREGQPLIVHRGSDEAG